VADPPIREAAVFTLLVFYKFFCSWRPASGKEAEDWLAEMSRLPVFRMFFHIQQNIVLILNMQ